MSNTWQVVKKPKTQTRYEFFRVPRVRKEIFSKEEIICLSIYDVDEAEYDFEEENIKICFERRKEEERIKNLLERKIPKSTSNSSHFDKQIGYYCRNKHIELSHKEIERYRKQGRIIYRSIFGICVKNPRHKKFPSQPQNLVFRDALMDGDHTCDCCQRSAWEPIKEDDKRKVISPRKNLSTPQALLDPLKKKPTTISEILKNLDLNNKKPSLTINAKHANKNWNLKNQ